MENLNCPQCGAPLTAGSTECRYCGEKINVPTQQPSGYQNQPQYQQSSDYQRPPQYQQPSDYQRPPQYNQQQGYQQSMYQQFQPGINPAWPIKSKTAAGILAIFLGGFGIHKFYLGKTGVGILCLLFCWTYIPAMVGFIEGIIYLASNEYNFQIKNRVRVR